MVRLMINVMAHHYGRGSVQPETPNTIDAQITETLFVVMAVC